MSEIQIYKPSLDGFDTCSKTETNHQNDEDLFLVDHAEYESERQAHEQTRKELEEAVIQKLSAINQFDKEREFCIKLTKELKELQDAIANHSTQIEFSGDPNSYYFEGVYRATDKGSNKIIYNAIQASRNRRKNNERI